MMRLGAARFDPLVGQAAGNVDIEQAVPVEVRELPSVRGKSNSTHAMSPPLHIRQAQGSGFESFDCAETLTIKQGSTDQ